MTVLTDTESQSLDVLVVCPETGMENVLTKIRKWNAEEQSRLKKWHIRFSIKKRFDLPCALNTANRNIEQSILVPKNSG
ncbi:MAG: hypothetical protein QNL62_12010 [Gammaproteobacteria bacterium]|nr:hypothetical protein [Gammaproteobacteria bacterium]